MECNILNITAEVRARPTGPAPSASESGAETASSYQTASKKPFDTDNYTADIFVPIQGNVKYATGSYTNPFTGVGSSSWRSSIEYVPGNSATIQFDSTRIIPDATHVRPRNVAMTYMIKT